MSSASHPLPIAQPSPAGRWRGSEPSETAEPLESKTSASYWLLLAFLLLLYANTAKLLPALEVLRPAAVTGGCALLALLSETVFGPRPFNAGWPEGGLLIAFCGAGALSCLTALWPNYSVQSLSDLAKMTLVFFFLVNTLDSDRKIRGVFWTMLVGGLFPALGTLNHYRTGNMFEGRAAWIGIFANPNEVAYALTILLPLAAFLFTSGRWFTRLMLLGLSCVYLAAIFVTFSRGGLLGLMVVVVLYAWRKRNALVVAALVLAAAGGLALAGRYWTRDADFSKLNNDLTFQQRIATSQAGVNMFLDHPLLGVGLNCSVVAWPLYAPPGLYTTGALITHNTFIQVLAETGVLGALPFLSLLAVSLYRSRKLALASPHRDLGLALEAAIWGLLICGMSGGYVLTWFPYLLMGLAAAAWRLPSHSLEVTP